MTRFWLEQISSIVLTLLGLTLLTFLMIHWAPGDPILLLVGERGIDPERLAALRAAYGLDAPWWQQYFLYLGRVFQGDLGISFVTKVSVVDEFFLLFPATLELGLCAMLFAIVLGIPMGILAAIKHQSWFDYSLMGVSLVGYSMPIFWWALLLILIFSLGLGITPVDGRIDAAFDVPEVTGLMLIDVWWMDSDSVPAFFDALHHLVLPSIVLGTIPLAIISRMTRTAMLEVLHEDYIRTARASGLPEWRVVLIHAFRNALIPIVTVIGMQLCMLLTGAILTETIFSWPGVGKWLVGAIERRDYPTVQGGILLIAMLVMIVNLGVDMLYAVINPKLRRS